MANNLNQPVLGALYKTIRILALCCGSVVVEQTMPAQLGALTKPAAPANATTPVKAAAPHTVTDFYMLLPGGMNAVGSSEFYTKHRFLFDLNKEGSDPTTVRAHRRSLITVEDIKNNYLKLESPNWLGGGERHEITQFKTQRGTSVVAVSQMTGDGCDDRHYRIEHCNGGLVFLEFAQNKWTDMTVQIFPFHNTIALGYNFSRPTQFGDCYFLLPHRGTDLRLWCNQTRKNSKNEKEDYTTEKRFAWNGVRFIKR